MGYSRSCGQADFSCLCPLLSPHPPWLIVFPNQYLHGFSLAWCVEDAPENIPNLLMSLRDEFKGLFASVLIKTSPASGSVRGSAHCADLGLRVLPPGWESWLVALARLLLYLLNSDQSISKDAFVFICNSSGPFQPSARGGFTPCLHHSIRSLQVSITL